MSRCLVVVAAWAAACAGEPVGPPIALKDLASTRNEGFCRNAVRCHQVASLDACLWSSLSLDQPLDPSLAAAIGAGTVVYDGASARACVDASARVDCAIQNALFAAPTSCTTIFRGTVRAGGACAINEECITQSCNVPACGDACCIGSCVGDPPVAGRLGDSCISDITCSEGLLCERNRDLMMVCTLPAPAGGTCISTHDCGAGMICNGEDFTCIPLPKAGQPCTDQCGEYGVRCSPQRHICVAYGSVGDVCAPDAPCAPLSFCDSTSHCRDLARTIPLGSPCNDPYATCRDPGAFCQIVGDSRGACVEFAQDGEPCDASHVCVREGVCDPTTQICDSGPICI